MAFFNNDSLFGYSGGVACAEGYDVDFGGYARIVEESCMDQLEIVKAMHSVDMQELNAAYKVRSIREAAGDEDDADGVDDAIEEFETAKEATIKEIFEKIKEGLKKFFSKLFGWIKSIWDKLVTFKKANKSFAETYRPVVEEYAEYITKPVEYTGFEYNISALDSVMGKMDDDHIDGQKKYLKATSDYVNGFDTCISLAKENKFKEATDAMNELAAKYNEETGAIEKGIDNGILVDGVDSNDDIKKAFRGVQTTVKYSAADIIKNLDVLEKLDMKQIKKYEAECKKAYTDAEASVKAAEAKYKKVPMSLDKTESAPAFNKIRNNCIGAASTISKSITAIRKRSMRVVSVYRECVIDYSNQIKHVTIKAIAEGKAAKKAADAKN